MKILTPLQIKKFQEMVYSEALAIDRKNLPWRRKITPYKILISEIMLQQTQVVRVVDFFNRWLEVFPDFEHLATAHTVDVLKLWKGLGYNNRGIRLHRLARIIVGSNNSSLPKTRKELESLPGIGPYTAGAIIAFAYNKPEIFIETNIRRVFIHHFFPDQENVSDKQLLPYLSVTLDSSSPRKWYWALMDYGSLIPKKEKFNPNTQSKHYKQQSKFSGSVRQMRSVITEIVLSSENSTTTLSLLQKKLGNDVRFDQAFSGLVKDRVISVKEGRVSIAS